MAKRLLTPSKITAWLGCAHFLTLRHQVEAGLVDKPQPTFGSLAQLLADKGLAHEAGGGSLSLLPAGFIPSPKALFFGMRLSATPSAR